MTARRLVLPALLLLAAIPRFVGLGYPPQLMFDESHYARDACTYVSSDGCGIDEEENFEHPPLGKWLIAMGIATFGNDAFGWRVMSALAGTLSILLLYLLALRVSGSVVIATLAGGLMALDPLHLVQSRIGMLDIFVLTFGLAALLCAYRARSSGSLWWLAGLGASGGAATACKWSGAVFLMLGLGVLALRDLSRPNDPASGSFGTGTTGTTESASVRRDIVAFPWASVLLALAVAAAVYILSYAGRLDGSWAALPWADGSWIRLFLARQAEMWSFHSGLDYQHPYASPPWDWLLLKRPVAYLFGTTSDGDVAEVLATGNPLLWWPAVAACVYCGWAWFKGRATPLMRLAVIGFLATLGIWVLFAAGRSAMFLFYMTSVLPFMYLALASVVTKWRWGPIVAGVVAMVPLLFLWPVLTGEPISPDAWRQRILFESCSGSGRTPEEVATPLIRATPGGAPPPPGWCWV